VARIGRSEVGADRVPGVAADLDSQALASLFRVPRIAGDRPLIICFTPEREDECARIYLAATRQGREVLLLPLAGASDPGAIRRLERLVASCHVTPAAVLLVEGDRLPEPAWLAFRRRTRLVLLTGCRGGSSPLRGLARMEQAATAAALTVSGLSSGLTVRSGGGAGELAVWTDPDAGWRGGLNVADTDAVVLPPGEVSARVVSAHGRFEAAGACLSIRTGNAQELAHTPVMVSVEEGLVTGYLTTHRHLSVLLHRSRERYRLDLLRSIAVGVGSPADLPRGGAAGGGIRLTIGVSEALASSRASQLQLELVAPAGSAEIAGVRPGAAARGWMGGQRG
jgi:hypothetical protein